MAHIQDRWYRDKTDPVTGEIVVNSKGKPVQEPTPEHGKGLRYRVKYQDPDKRERSKSFPDKQLGRAKEFMTKVENDKYAGTYTDP
ncbi:site-specific integrase, partial [Crossiella sp. CA198]